jgi:DNA-binding beta-propeller fold protein YncE
MKKVNGIARKWWSPVAALLTLAALWMASGPQLLSRPAARPSPTALSAGTVEGCDFPAASGREAEAPYAGSWTGETVPARLIRDPGARISRADSGAMPAAPAAAARVMGGDIVPCRSIEDPYPILHSVAVDDQNNIVVMSDSNRGTLLFYKRTSHSIAGKMTPTEWQVSGPATGMMFVAGVAVDPARREAYTVDNDIGNRMMVFHYGADGNARPERVLFVPHGAWGISLNRPRDEIAITVEHINSVVVYRREASGAEAPLRVISGIHTGLADPHGVFFDATHNEILVANHGNWAPATRTSNPGMGGHFYPPSITVYPGTAKGDVAPRRVISGPRTQLNWPMGIAVDALHNEMAVANYGNNSILIFHRDDHGDVAPVRVIHGSATGIAGPMGVAIDAQHHELWVSNSGDHSAVVFSLTAEGNAAPQRVLRNAPAGAADVGFGNPGALAYDSKRNELLVPN